MPRVHVCQPGECLIRAASRYLVDYRVVVDHPDNRALMDKRKNPDMLFPGDRLTIPDGKQLTYVLETGKRHRILVPSPRRELRLVLKDGTGQPLANRPYQLTLTDAKNPDKRNRSGTTDDQGMLREAISIRRKKAVSSSPCPSMRLRPARSWSICFGRRGAVATAGGSCIASCRTTIWRT